MIIAKVIGNVVATKKNAALSGEKIMIVQAVDKTGHAKGHQMMAFDIADAGIGDYVIVAVDGGAAKQLVCAPKNAPIDVCIAGIVDNFIIK